MRRAAKRDLNEQRIKDFLLRCGYSVIQVNQGALPDLLVGFGGSCNLLLEVKGEHGSLTEPQMVFFDTWRGQADVVRSIKDVKEVLRRVRPMPVYIYKCEECEHILEIKQRMSDPPLENCPECGAKVNRIVQIPAVIYNGDGFTKRVKKDV